MDQCCPPIKQKSLNMRSSDSLDEVSENRLVDAYFLLQKLHCLQKVHQHLVSSSS